MIVSEKQARAAWDLLCPYSVIENGDLMQVVNAEHPEDVVRDAYRQAAKAAHPDKGGTAEAFAAVDRAKHVLLAWLGRPQPVSQDHKKKPCDYCGGNGHVYTAGRAPGSAGLRRTCPKCRGSGDADIDLHNP